MTTKPKIDAKRAARIKKRGIALVEQFRRGEEELFKSLGPAGTKELLAKRAREFQEANRLQIERDNAIVERMARSTEIESRRQNLPPTSELVKLVWELAALAGYKTSPRNPNSMSEKDQNSHRAFQLAGQLIGPLLRWAIDHEAGKIIGNNASLVEWQAHFNENAKTAAFVSKRNLNANSHDNELRGQDYEGNNTRVDRELAALVLYSISNGMDFESGKRMGRALTLLQHGEVAALLAPSKSRRKQKNRQIELARLRAIEHVEYRRGMGAGRNEALEQAAEAYTQHPGTIRQWKKESFRRLSTLDPAYVVNRRTSQRD